jgi:uncharacterized protein DUF397
MKIQPLTKEDIMKQFSGKAENVGTFSGYTPVRPFRKSSFSNPSGECIEIGVWKKSTASNSSANCVETAGLKQADGNVMIGVRDSKQHGAGPVLKYTRGEWQAFIKGVKASEFDLA